MFLTPLFNLMNTKFKFNYAINNRKTRQQISIFHLLYNKNLYYYGVYVEQKIHIFSYLRALGPRSPSVNFKYRVQLNVASRVAETTQCCFYLVNTHA